MSVTVKPNSDGTTSFLNTSGVEVLKVPSNAGSNTTVATQGDVIGVGQTLQDVTANRSPGVTYTNSTGKPILINISGYGSASGVKNAEVSIDGGAYIVIVSTGSTSAANHGSGTMVIPNGSSYTIRATGFFISKWSELR